MGHGASRLILRGVVLLGPFSLGFHCGQSSTECSHPCGDSRFTSRFSFDVLGRLDFRFRRPLVFICLRVFDLAATRFELFFDLTRRFDEVLDLARFFAFFMIPPFD
jgi:hypothetical protein